VRALKIVASIFPAFALFGAVFGQNCPHATSHSLNDARRPLFQLLKLRLFVAADSLLIESLRLAA